MSCYSSYSMFYWLLVHFLDIFFIVKWLHLSTSCATFLRKRFMLTFLHTLDLEFQFVEENKKRESHYSLIYP